MEKELIMTEQNLPTGETPSGDRQDPAEQYRTDESVETQAQAPDADVSGPDDSSSESGDTAGSEEVSSDDGESDSSQGDNQSPEFTEPQPVEVTPAPSESTTTRIGGEDYTVTSDRGHRLS